ncbi:Protein of unknown function [Sphingomonas sp. NFR04]|uniref:DUF2493 domain-containing protein n=1 Tax=Sphingomonas sp. NFR04 TaxID=1566283 RepID=UPI0008E26EC3|nr:DUF2493 domain-containing protein [Sphingomonas sp. NFR04]SFJ46873.1 Protein of unknown function [Sphingomonas sp. NFR04]
MRVLVTGGRYFNLVDEVHRVLSRVHQKHGIEELGEGWATGADELCRLWALAHGIPVASYEANWKTFGGRAGIMRNASMLRAFKPDLAIAFPGGDGTRDMRYRLREARVPTMVGRFTDTSETALAWDLWRPGH